MLETLWAYTKILIIILIIFTIILINFLKKIFLFTSFFPFFRKEFWNPETSLGFFILLFFFYRRPLKRRLANAKDARSRARCLYATVCFYLFKKIVFEFRDNIFLVGTAWRQTFVMTIRNLSGYMKISPGNSLGDSSTFCCHESTARWEPSFRVKF